MTIPEPLRYGDKVAIVATARKISPQETQPAIDMLKRWGLQPVVQQGLYEEYNQFAGTDRHRAEMLQNALDDDSIRAILCARGGYGTARIIDKINLSGFMQSPKWVVGYSDVTVLHSHLHTNAHCASAHAIMPVNITDGNADSLATSSLHDLLFATKKMRYDFDCADGINIPGNATGQVVGGNLSILYSLIGSPSDIDTRGKILMIEDLDEYLYHIDRMMLALRRSGKLQGLKALVVGQFTDLHDNSVPFGMSIYDIVRDAVAGYDFPVCFNAPFGHIEHRNLALPLGVTATVSVSSNSAHIEL
ncbi:MAG: LD-carboxypeptidase [Bacteroidales bacterium]|nr:LD-carboxypeptidase [Bacteroidales bacterium]